MIYVISMKRRSGRRRERTKRRKTGERGGEGGHQSFDQNPSRERKIDLEPGRRDRRTLSAVSASEPVCCLFVYLSLSATKV